jgi:hypothetical protein
MRIETLLADRGLKPRIAYEIDAIASILDLPHEGRRIVAAAGDCTDDRNARAYAENRVRCAGQASVNQAAAA